LNQREFLYAEVFNWYAIVLLIIYSTGTVVVMIVW